MTDFGGRDAYAILGVPRGSSDEQIAAAFRRLARRFHPDIAGDHATAEMMRINAAFDCIRTAARRADHDERNRSGAPTPPGPRPGSGAGGTTDEAPGRDRPRWAPERDGTGGAGPPPGRPSGTILDFGRHIGWSIGEVARVDPGYLQWLSERREGRPYLDEIDATLRRVGFRSGPPPDASRSRTGTSWRR